MELRLANPRGFCAGVDRAIEIVERALERFGSPVYVLHEIVHNKHVLEHLSARGTVFETPDFAVSYEGSEALRQSPGYRNVGVYACTNAEALGAWLAPAGAHLKCLGIAADRSQRERVAAELPATLAPRVCGVGCMQSPPLSRLSDGEPAWRGLLRFIELG